MNKKFVAILLTLAMSSTLMATTSSAEYISKSKAKEIVLAHAGVSATNATFVKTELDTENGKHEIDLEFFVPFSINGISVYKEYDYDLNAFNGAILSLDWDIEEFNNSIPDKDWDGTDDRYDNQDNNWTGNVKYLSESEAKNIVLNHAKVQFSDAIFVKTELDYDDGLAELELEFFVKTVVNNQTVYKEYDYELDAITGRIISSDLDIENFNDSDNNQWDNNDKFDWDNDNDDWDDQLDDDDDDDWDDDWDDDDDDDWGDDWDDRWDDDDDDDWGDQCDDDDDDDDWDDDDDGNDRWDDNDYDDDDWDDRWDD